MGSRNIYACAIAVLALIAYNPMMANNLEYTDEIITKNKILKLNDTGIAHINGQIYVVININPFILQIYENEARRLGYEEAKLGDESKTKDDWHNPGVRLIADTLEEEFDIKINHLTSWTSPGLFGWMTVEKAREILNKDYTSSIEQLGEMSYSATWNDSTTPLGDFLPWGRLSVTNDAYTTTTNSITFIDGNLDDTSSINSEVYILSKNDYPGGGNTGQYHSFFIAGLIGAKNNGSKIIGINPDQPLRFYGTDSILTIPTPPASPLAGQVAYALDKAVSDMESFQSFSVLNLSINGNKSGIIAPNDQPLSSTAAMGARLRGASNRFFITNSSGNIEYSKYSSSGANACYRAYHHQGAPRANDGVVTVGGYDNNGEISIDTNESSTYGNCIEVWGPAKNLTSLPAHGYPFSTIVRTGTSFSAPIVAALASRYGNSKTRPIEREQFVMANLVSNGKYDPTAKLIKRLVWNSNYSSSIKRLPSTAISGTGPYTANLSYVSDQKFSNTFWNTGNYTGSVVIDLGTTRSVRGVRLTLRSSAAYQIPNPIDFQVFRPTGYDSSGNPITWTSITSMTETYQADMAPVWIPFIQPTRYLKIDGNNSGSWLAYAEIEVYGF